MQVKKQKLELDVKQWTCSNFRKEFVKAVYILSPFLLNLYAEYIMQNAGLDEVQAGINETSITSDMQMTPPLWQKAKKN